MAFDFSQGPVKPAAWNWNPELLSERARSYLSGALGVYPFWETSGPSVGNLIRAGWPDGVLASGATWTAGAHGPAVAVQGTPTTYIDFQTNLAGATEWTYLIASQIRQSTSNSQFMGGQLKNASFDYDLGGPYFPANGTYFFSGSEAYAGIASSQPANGDYVVYVCRYVSGETNGTQLWKDGDVLNQSTTSPTPTQNYNFYLGKNVGGNNEVDHDPYLFAVWNRGLSAEECAELSADPLQLIRPDPAKILPLLFAEQAAGGVTVTPATADAISAIVAPSVTLGSISLSPEIAAATAAAIAPTILYGALSITPGTADATSSAISPTVASAISISPANALATVSATSPTVVFGSLALTPSQASAVATALLSDAIYGSVSISPANAASIATAIAPTIALTGIIAPEAAIAAVTAIAPGIVFGSVSFTPAQAAAVSDALINAVVLSTGLDRGIVRPLVRNLVSNLVRAVSN